MTILPRRLADSKDGAAAVEFALVAPFLLMLLMGVLEVGTLFMARAGLGQAVESGARYATLYPQPSDAQIADKILSSGYGMRNSGITGPTFVRGTFNGTPYVEITVIYAHTMQFAFFETRPITLRYTRRAYQV